MIKQFGQVIIGENGTELITNFWFENTSFFRSTNLEVLYATKEIIEREIEFLERATGTTKPKIPRNGIKFYRENE